MHLHSLLLFLADENNPELLEFNPWSMVWILGIFLVVAIVLYRTAWKNVLIGLKAREDRIRKDIADAEAARIKAEDTLKQYDNKLSEAQKKVMDLLDQARQDAEKIGTSLRMRAQQEVEEIKERAAKEMEAAKRMAINEVYEQAVYLATSAAEKILRHNLNPDSQRDLVNQSIQETIPKLETIGKN